MRILRGEFRPGTPLRPQELAASMGVSLSVVREALQRLIGEGLADRHPNRGFSVPAFSDLRWQQIAEARRILEPSMLRMAIARGDLEWETRIRAAHHRLDRTPLWTEKSGSSPTISDVRSTAHYKFHRTLLDGCANPVLLETFDRMWTVSELARRWSGQPSTARDPSQHPRQEAVLARDADAASEHRKLEEAVLARDADTAAAILDHHLALTAAAFSPSHRPAKLPHR